MLDKKRRLENNTQENNEKPATANDVKKRRLEESNTTVQKTDRASFQSPLPKKHFTISETVKIYVERYKEKALIQMIREKKATAALHFLTEKSFQKDLKKCINTVDKNKCNAIYYAIANNLKELIKLLAEKGVDINAESNFHKNPLHYAMDKEQVEAAKILLELKCESDFLITNKCWTAMHIAVVKEDMVDLIQPLKENGCDISTICSYGKAPIHYAISLPNNAVELIHELCENGANINQASRNGMTIAHMMFEKKSISFEKLYILSAHGANFTQYNKLFKTPVDYLFSTEAVTLLAQGVDLQLEGLYLQLKGLDLQAEALQLPKQNSEQIKNVKSQILQIETPAEKLKAKYIAYCFTSIVKKHSLKGNDIDTYYKNLTQFITIEKKAHDFIEQYLKTKDIASLSDKFPQICIHIEENVEQNKNNLSEHELQDLVGQKYLLEQGVAKNIRRAEYKFWERMCKYLSNGKEDIRDYIMHYINNNAIALKLFHSCISKEEISYKDKQSKLLLGNLELKPFKGNEEYFNNNASIMCEKLIYNTMKLYSKEQER